jgi:hypothetical protein
MPPHIIIRPSFIQNISNLYAMQIVAMHAIINKSMTFISNQVHVLDNNSYTGIAIIYGMDYHTISVPPKSGPPMQTVHGNCAWSPAIYERGQGLGFGYKWYGRVSLQGFPVDSPGRSGEGPITAL